MDESQLDIEHYDYELPKELIAQHPLKNRTDARLLVVDRKQQRMDHFHVRDLPRILEAGDLLVINDTKVIPAQLMGYREKTNGRWQGLFLEADEMGLWKVLAKTRGNIQPGETVMLKDRDGVDRLRVTVLARLNQGAWAVKPEQEGKPEELLEAVGRVPLPHYIRNGNMVDQDLQTYQTVFAENPGAVAAPTAGLHLTHSLMEDLKSQGVGVARTTLHVGIGTFRPIKTTRVDEHEMHEEFGVVSQEVVDQINQAKQAGGRVIAVGTTSVRSLETASLSGAPNAWQGSTGLYIYPGFQFHCVQGMMTNFHLPRTSLLVMVRTFGGDELIKRAYREAVEQEYRFYSYGDAMLIL